MRDWQEFFKNKRVTIMGLGLLGRGVGDAAFIARYAREVIVTDLKSAAELKSSLKKLKQFKNIRYTLGRHDLKDFEGRDFILKAAGVPLDSKYILHAREKDVPVYMSTALLAKFSPARIIGVTGTRGKTTVTYMIYDALRLALKNKAQRVYIGGNIQGMSTLALLPKIKKGDLLVLELDSWQLQGFGDLKISPQIAIFTTFMPDHLNYYKGDLRKYFKDKANIFKFQKSKDVRIIGSQIKKIGKKYDLPKDIKLALPGEHNRYNAGLAYAALKSLKVSDTVIKKSFERFSGVPGRLEFAKKTKGVKIYNDTTSTTPHALKAALEALKEESVVLIAGGSDKNIDLHILKKSLQICKAIVLLPGSGTDRLIKEKVVSKFTRARDMGQAVKLAFKYSTKSDTLLLSPGFASFGLFKNEYDRGDQFLRAVASLSK